MIGHRGWLVRLLPSSVARFPAEPLKWSYRVWLPHFHSHIDVPADMLHLTGGAASETWRLNGFCEVQFDLPTGDEELEIFGAYRLPAENWTDFHFRRKEQRFATYRFAMPVEKHAKRNCLLTYFVPSGETLNRAYVVKTVKESILPKDVATFG